MRDCDGELEDDDEADWLIVCEALPDADADCEEVAVGVSPEVTVCDGLRLLLRDCDKDTDRVTAWLALPVPLFVETCEGDAVGAWELDALPD